MMAITIVHVLVLAYIGATMASIFPPNSWDSHIHVIDPQAFPMSEDRDYTPKPATKQNATTYLSTAGIAHAVIVLPSVYGTDNSVLIDSLKYFNGSARGVAVVDPDNVSNETIEELHAAGVRGLRVNFGNEGTDEEIIDAIHKNAALAQKNNWVLQLWIPLKAFVALHPIIPTLGVRVVVDHFAHTEVGSRTNSTLDTIDPYRRTGFSEVVDLVRRRLLWVKISGPYQNSKAAPLYDDLRIVAQTLMLNGPEMVVYGSDWPHTASKEGNAAAGGRLSPQNYRDINDPAIAELFMTWAGSQEQIQRLFVDNPRRLWSWDDPSS
ncbi:4-sulfomuconolactone hydrolase [Pseudocercospora fuligena]|uniref:4-sulfomuconolactone hydrolase n=1 Tax=Pseudocercospora fuligena TaxID=685502 RepID=A0A8H6RV46_9PEZI|nr:4-sulfomuconolactone hydrolase [Pseudocercospora fuligena]